MTIFDRMRGRGQPSPPPDDKAAIALPVVMAALQANLAALEKKQIQPSLVRARLADWLRDAALEPPAPDQVNKWVAALDAEGWRRLALLVAALEPDALSALVAAVAARRDVHWLVKEGLVGAAASMPLLTVSLLRESAVRLEELARGWLAALGVAVAGETAAQSGERLRRIDYGRLLGQAERAKQAAEARMAELRKQQEQVEQRRTTRSKW